MFVQKVMLNKGICYVCGKGLIYDPAKENCSNNEFVDDEDIALKTVQCEHCGTIYNYYMPSEVSPFECREQGFGNCICGGVNVWGSDFMRSDFDYNDDGTELDEENDAIVRSLTCSSCGAAIEVFEPTLQEQQSGKFPFWNK